MHWPMMSGKSSVCIIGVKEQSLAAIMHMNSY
jgi:hypothetical protein